MDLFKLLERGIIGALLCLGAVANPVKTALGESGVLGVRGADPAALHASAGKIEITPDMRKPVYLAGYGAKGRKATAVHDPLYARGVAFRRNETTLVLMALDLIGFPLPYVEKIRAAFPNIHLLIAATHTHSGPDTLGLWGPKPGVSGVDAAYMQYVVEQTQKLAANLLSNLKPAQLKIAQSAVPVKGLVHDLRDPVVMDNTLTVLKLNELHTNKNIGLLVNWACHPEVLGPDNTLITADYVHYLTDYLEKKGLGTAVFFSGAIGGLMSPDSQADTFAESERIGTELGRLNEEALKIQGQAIDAESIVIASAKLRLPIDNILYLAMLENAGHGRPLFNAKNEALKKIPYARGPKMLRPIAAWINKRLLGAAAPWLETELNFIQMGALSIFGMPGEIFPELYLRGYEGQYRFHHPLISPSNPKPPTLEKAPRNFFLKEQMPGRFSFLIGLANDEIGYIVPDYDFRVNKWSPYMYPEPKGHHYEETNSLGPRTAGLIIEKAKLLLDEARKKR